MLQSNSDPTLQFVNEKPFVILIMKRPLPDGVSESVVLQHTGLPLWHYRGIDDDYLADDMFVNEKSYREAISTLIDRIQGEHSQPIMLLTQSEMALQWVNNAVLLDRAISQGKQVDAKIRPFPQDKVAVYEYDWKEPSFTEIKAGEYGFYSEYLATGLNELFEESTRIQKALDTE